MISNMLTITADQLKRDLADRKIIAILFVYIAALGIGMKFGSLLGIVAKMVFLQTDLPVQMIITYYTSLIFGPLLAVLLSFDNISSETSTNSMSYLAVRTSRTAIMLGKYFATAALVASINLAVYIGAVVYFNLKTGKVMLEPALTLWLYLSIYLLVFISIGFLCSTIARRNQSALWAAIALVTLAILVSAKDSTVYLSPFTYSTYILDGPALLGAGALILFAAAGIALAILAFQRKDIC